MKIVNVFKNFPSRIFCIVGLNLHGFSSKQTGGHCSIQYLGQGNLLNVWQEVLLWMQLWGIKQSIRLAYMHFMFISLQMKLNVLKACKNQVWLKPSLTKERPCPCTSLFVYCVHIKKAHTHMISDKESAPPHIHQVVAAATTKTPRHKVECKAAPTDLVLVMVHWIACSISFT